MATTVIQAFDEFLRDVVNLDSDQVGKARASRSWLRGILGGFHVKHDDFPLAYSDVDADFGSFARRTKIRELDDVDLIHGLSANGATYLDQGGRVTITVPSGSRLWAFRHDGGDLLNSRRVINKFVKHLEDVPQYSSAGINRRGEAAVLNLKSYSWSFDIVPGFFTSPEWDGSTYYIIPDGDGHWKKTDPRLDGGRVTSVNQAHDGYVLNVVRIIKYWNRRPTMPSMSSYLLECMVMDYYEGRATKAVRWVDMEIPGVLAHIASAVLGTVNDPKRIQGDLNTLDRSERWSIRARALQDETKAREARQLEEAKNHKDSISKWGEVFGKEFPKFSEARSASSLAG